MKQTAVEYAFERLYKMGIIENIDDPLVQQILNESKEIEKEQIQDSHRNGFTGGVIYATNILDTSHRHMSAEQYYNETYRKR